MAWTYCRAAGCCVALLLVLTGCSGSPALENQGDGWIAGSLPPTSSSRTFGQDTGAAVIEAGDQVSGQPDSRLVQSGNDTLFRLPTGKAPTATPSNGARQGLTFNLVDAPISEAAKVVLGDILGANYAIEGNVAGAITWRTLHPLSRQELLEGFEAALQTSGATMVQRHGMIRIISQQAANAVAKPIETELGSTGPVGTRNFVLGLRYVSAHDMQEVLEPLAPPGTIVRIDQARNALVLQGTPAQLAAVRETAELFDVDWLSGMSFALHPLRYSSPVAVARELDTIFATKNGPLKGVVRFVPNARLKSILVISSRRAYLPKAMSWISRLDVEPNTVRPAVHVYNVQNRNAEELARILQSVYRPKSGEKIRIDNAIAPRETSVQALAPADNPEQQPTVVSSAEGAETAMDSLSDDLGSADEDTVRIVPDDPNNALIILATISDYEDILDVLRSIDSRPNQVLLEVVIAEVLLNDQLQFGVRWYLGRQSHHATFSDAVTGAVASVFPGFSYLLAANNLEIALNALNSVTDVKVISSPSLMVLDNRKATLQVGDQVPIVVQQSTDVTAAGAPVVNAIEQKDTGVILSVTPRVNDSGRVVMEIEQEVSSVVPTTTSGIDSPTIRRRKVTTSVVVQDGETLTLGGLIQKTEDRNDEKVPLLGDLPYLGTAFRSRDTKAARTELVIFVRPRVVRDSSEAFEVTEEYRKRLRNLDRPAKSKADNLSNTFNRIVE